MAHAIPQSFIEKTQTRVRVWMRDNCDEYDMESLGDEAAWLFNCYTEAGDIPDWVRDYATAAKENRL